MDTITHTLFGAALYGTIDKRGASKQLRRAFLFTSIGASQIPDIDVVSRMWDTEGMYQMWHRGITHSVFLMPVWALLFYVLSIWLFKVRDKRMFPLALLAVFIHSTSDLFNAWGTGYIEPFSSIRVTFGTIPIVDFMFWFILLVSVLFTKVRSSVPSYKVYRWAWAAIVIHICLQSVQGYVLYHSYEKKYDTLALSASFLPGHFSIIGKKGGVVQITDDSLFTKPKLQHTLYSSEDADLDQLFQNRPTAKTLYEWSPFVVVVDDEERLGIYDPRFYRNGQSFLFEYIEKNTEK